MKELRAKQVKVEEALSRIESYLDEANEKGNNGCRRKYRRYAHKHLRVKYQVFRYGSREFLPGFYESILLDVSGGGMRIEDNEQVKIIKGQRISFEIINQSLAVVLQGFARVVRFLEVDGVGCSGFLFQEVKK